MINYILCGINNFMVNVTSYLDLLEYYLVNNHWLSCKSLVVKNHMLSGNHISGKGSVNDHHIISGKGLQNI